MRRYGFTLFMSVLTLIICGLVPILAQDSTATKTIEIRELANFVNSPAPVTVEGIAGETRKYSPTTNSYLLSRMFVNDDKDKIWVKTNNNYPDKDRQYRVTGTVVREGERLFLLEQKRELIADAKAGGSSNDEKADDKSSTGFALSKNMLLGLALIGVALILGIVIAVSMRKQADAQKMMLEQQRQAMERERERIQKAASPASPPTGSATVIADSLPGKAPKRPQHTVEAWGQLKVTTGPHIGLIAPLTGRQVIIGRDEGDLQLPDDAMISSRHGEIVATNDGRLLYVDQSRNGSTVDGNPVHRNQVEITVSSIIEVGGSRIEIHAIRPPVMSNAAVEAPRAAVPGAAMTMIGGEMPPKPAAATGICTGVELVVVSGADLGKRFPIGKETVTIGRREDQDITLTDGFVSREHAVCYKRGNDWALRNISDKGTTINGEPCTEAIIKQGDRIALGSTVFEVSVAGEGLQRSAKTICD